MITIDLAAVAERALLIEYAQDAFELNPRELAPPLDPRALDEWELVGHLVAVDCAFRKGLPALGDNACYGYVARSRVDADQYVAVIRGTGSLVEWVEDAEFAPTPHPVAGRVESGFWGVYRSMRFVPLVGDPVAAADGVAAAIGAGRVVVTGHSLGAALATYLTFDLAAALGERLEATILASPHPGDAAFAAAFDARVLSYQLINRVVDAVPHIPFGPDYAHLPKVVWRWPKDEDVKVKLGLFCQHHVVVYALTLCKKAVLLKTVAPIDFDNAACVKAA
jgi:triacylglycerol lipase